MNQSYYKDVTFVVQGPVIHNGRENITKKCINSIKYYYPYSKIILSTWNNSDVIPDVRTLINHDPGPIPTNDKYFSNYNRMVLSTSVGISAVETTYCAKVRSDFWFDKYFPLLDVFEENKSVSKKWSDKVTGRIMMCMQESHYKLYPYYPSDWFHFGYTSDMKKLWNGKLVTEFSNHFYPSLFGGLFFSSLGYGGRNSIIDHAFHSEQQLCINYLSYLNVPCAMKSSQDANIYYLARSYKLLGELFFVIRRSELGLISETHKVTGSPLDLELWDIATSNKRGHLRGTILLYRILSMYIAREMHLKLNSLIRRFH